MRRYEGSSDLVGNADCVKRMIRDACKQCGYCCLLHWGSFEATYDDVTRWRNEGRTDILNQLVVDSNDPSGQSWKFISNRCPFLRKNELKNKYYCAINDTKPFYCKNYPDDGICERAEGPPQLMK